MIEKYALSIRGPHAYDDVESLNTDDVLSVILKIERESAMKSDFNLKCDVFSNTFYL